MAAQEVILYRNPFEYALWNSGLVFPLIVAMVVAVVVAFVISKYIVEPRQFNHKSWISKYSGEIVVIPTILSVVAVLWYMV